MVFTAQLERATKFSNMLNTLPEFARACWVDSIEAVQQRLQSTLWNVCLIDLQAPIDSVYAIQLVQSKETSCSIIIVYDQETLETAHQLIELGAHNIVFSGNQKAFCLTVLKEFNTCALNQQFWNRHIQYQSLQNTVETLQTNTSIPMAYSDLNCQQFTQANQAFVQLLGHKTEQQLLERSTKDILHAIPKENHTQYKRMLYSMKRQNLFQKKFFFKNKNTNQCLILEHAESKQQPNIRWMFLNKIEHSHDQQDYQYSMLLKDIHLEMYRVINDHQPLSLIAVQLHAFDRLKMIFSLETIDELLQQFFHFMQVKYHRGQDRLYRLDQAMAAILIPESNLKQAQQFSKRIATEITQEKFSTQDRTIQAEVDIEVMPINSNTMHIDSLINTLKEKLQQTATCNDTLLQRLDTAITQNKIKLLFQPIINLNNDGKKYYEVFSQLSDEYGRLPLSVLLKHDIPDKLKLKLDQWLILNICKNIQNRPDDEKHQTIIFFSPVNMHFQLDKFTTWTAQLFEKLKISHNNIVFQYSEEILLNTQQHTSMNEMIKQLNLKLAVNQFGRSVNSFELFHHLHIHYVKLDASFSKELSMNRTEIDEEVKHFTQKLNQYSQQNILPFVESIEDIPKIIESGIQFVQGYGLQVPTESMSYDLF